MSERLSARSLISCIRICGFCHDPELGLILPSCAFAQVGRESLEVSWNFTSRPSIQGPEVYPHPSCRLVCSSCDEQESWPPAAAAITRGRGWGICFGTFRGAVVAAPTFGVSRIRPIFVGTFRPPGRHQGEGSPSPVEARFTLPIPSPGNR